MSDLFKDLSKHISERHEDFLTNSFVYLINYLLENERSLGIALLNFICVKNSEFVFSEGEELLVTTQKVTIEGTPDIAIKSNDKCIYIEVKHDSGLGHQQIEKYRRALEAESVSTKKIILLTKFAQDFEQCKREGTPDKHIRWYQIHRFLEELNPNDEICKFLISQFTDFMEDKQMAIQKVNWEYTNGIRAFNNLINMIEAARQELGIKIHSKSAAWEWKGYYLENKEQFCGVDYGQPDFVYYQLINASKYNLPNEKFPYPFDTSGGGVNLKLLLEDCYFFALQRDQQLEILKKFMSTCHEEAKKLKK